MKPKLIAFNVLLVAAIAVVLWQARARWNDSRAARHNNLEVTVKPLAPPPLSATPRPETPPATRYADVATKDLFAKDRNPTVIIEPPKAEAAPEKVMPPLPIVYGVLDLPSGLKALMAEKSGSASKPVRIGDSVGEFKIAALDAHNVTFDWDGKEIARKLEDLMDRSAQAQSSGPAAQPAAAAAPPPQQFSTSQQPQQQQAANPPPANMQPGSPIGAEIGPAGRSERMCRGSDTSAAGAVVDGYKKVITATAFGSNCRWIPVQ